MSEFIQIGINDLMPHPDNPRKDLGDLAELTESIRTNGILQNLTVVKDGDKYKVIIGHRRLAAAKAAGLTELPCTVADMDERQQLCTMMEENMQRQDLTIPEQAYGFQYMLDLGETVSSIAKKTGFSEQTVKHRLEIAKLKKKLVLKVEKNEDWQMSIKDYIELEKIKDIKTRESIIKDSLHSHYYFKTAVQNAIRNEKRKAAKEKWIPLLEAAGVKPAEKSISTYDGKHRLIREIDLDESKVPKKLILRDYDKNEPLVWIESYGSIEVLQKRKEHTQKLTKKEIEKQEDERKAKKLKNIEKKLFKEMKNHVRAVFDGEVEEPPTSSEMEVLTTLWNLFFKMGSYLCLDTRNVQLLTAKKYYWELDQEEKTELEKKMAAKRISTQLLVAMAESWGNVNVVGYYDNTYSAIAGKRGMQIYEILHEFYGFAFSNPEYLKVLNGSHEDYKKEKTEVA